MVPFGKIYDKAVNLFDDPDIRKAYVCDKVKFQKKMYAHFQNGINLFTNPMSIAFALSDRSEPSGLLETIDGDGTDTYILESVPLEGSVFTFKIGSKIDSGAIYNSDNNSVTFSQNVPEGAQCSVEWYFSGAFNTDFANLGNRQATPAVITQYVENILAHALVLAWAENEQNFALEIRNLLTDTDFKIYSPANSIKAKTEWVRRLRFEFDSYQNKLSWMMFGQFRSGGQLYGP